MTSTTKSARNAWQGTTGNNRNPIKGTDMKNSVPAAAVTTAAGFIVQPDSLLMRSICNGDNPAAFADRGRYFITAGVSL